MDTKELQAQIEIAEAAIKLELQRVIDLAEFSEFSLTVEAQKMTSPEKRPAVKVIKVTITAAL